MNEDYLKLIQSDRVSVQTRKVLLDRMQCDYSEYAPTSVTPELFAVLRAVVERLIPQFDSQDRVEIAAILDARKTARSGDGWRFADLPPDDVAFASGLRLLDAAAKRLFGEGFVLIDEAKQNALLSDLQSGKLGTTELNASHWFEDILAESIEIYVSHPATLARLGFSGIAYLPRWSEIGLNSTRPWESRPT